MTGEPPDGENPVVPFLLAGPQPDRTRAEGWQQWRAARGTFIPAPRLPAAEYQALSLRGRALHDLHRTATHVNLRLQETPMSRKVSDLMRGRLQNNAVKFTPGTRDGLMINGDGFHGKTETACQAAAEFEDLWRDIHRQLAPGPLPGCPAGLSGCWSSGSRTRRCCAAWSPRATASVCGWAPAALAEARSPGRSTGP
jgi:hypothetical protein